MNLSNVQARTARINFLGTVILCSFCGRVSAQEAAAPTASDTTTPMWKAIAERPVAPLHGTAQLVRDGGNLTLDTTWNRPFEGKIWVGFAQDGALYASQNLSIANDNKHQLRLALPTNLPAGHIDVQCVPLAQPVAESATSSFELAANDGDAKAFPRAWGIYRDINLVMHPWTVSAGNMMMWDGEPYVPVGGMVNLQTSWLTKAGESDQTSAQFYGYNFANAKFDLLKQYGLRDIYFNGFFKFSNPNALSGTVGIAEQKGMRYGISVASYPDNYNLGFLSNAAPIDVPATATGAEIRIPIEAVKVKAQHRCIWALLSSDGQILQTGIGTFTTQTQKDKPEMKDLVLTAHFNAGSSKNNPRIKGSTNSRRLIYSAELPMSGSDPTGFFDRFDKYLADLKQVYGSLPLGPGMRCWLDPLGNEAFGDKRQLTTSPVFRDGFKHWLFDKYSDVSQLNTAWQSVKKRTPLASFAQAAGLVPFYEHDGQAFWMEVETGKLFTFSSAGSEALRDLTLYRAQVSQQCFNRVADLLKTIADVPVICKHNTWFNDWFVNPQKAGGLDGVGYEPYGNGDSLIYHNGLVAYAEVAAAGRSQWAVVTETSPAAFDGQKNYVGYVDRIQMLDDFDQLLKIGAKGIYTFGFVFDPGSNFQVTELLRDPRQLEWLATYQKTLQAAASRLENYRPEVHGWYPAYLRENEIVRAPVDSTFGSHVPSYGMDGMYLGVASQIRMAPDGRWIVPAFRPDAKWKSVLSADNLLTPTERKLLAATRAQTPVAILGDRTTPVGKNTFPLNGFTANGIGVISKAQAGMTLDEFRQKVLGYRVFRTADANGQTLPDGRVMVWTCVERDQATLQLPKATTAVNIQGESVVTTPNVNGNVSLTLTRPSYEQSTQLPPYLNVGYYYPDKGQSEVVILSGVKVDDILRLNAPDWQRWLPTGVEAQSVAVWQEAEEPVETTFVQPRIEGYSRYSGAGAIAINTHFSPPKGQDFHASYNVNTNQPASKIWIRRMTSPAMDLEVWIDGKEIGLLKADAGAGSDSYELTPWNAGLGAGGVHVAWYSIPLERLLAAGTHTVKLVALSSQKSKAVDTKLLGGQAEHKVLTESISKNQGLQIDVVALTR